MRGHSARRVLTFVGIVSAAVAGFAIPASAHGAPVPQSQCNCSTTTSSTTTSTTATTTTTVPSTTTTEAGTTTVASTSTTGTPTTYIRLVPPVTVTAPPGSVVEQQDTTTTRDGAETDRLPHTGSSPLLPVTFGFSCLIVGAALALRRKPREWYGS
jgi:LPXTG-motif cell wall-anchored protein